MGNHYGLFISVASICGLVQSAVWASLAVFSCLVYLCVVPVPPYKSSSDFFRVTFVKLYFEGPRCIPNGSYLGKFDEEYRNPEKINLLAPDIVFTIMVVKVIFDVAYIILSILLYNTNKTGSGQKLWDLVVSWSVITLIMAAVDAFFSAELLLDIFSLTRYLDREDVYADDTSLRGIQFIPLILGIMSCRLVVFWFWNVGVASCFLITSFCCKNKLSKSSREAPPEPVTVSQVQTLSTELSKRFSENKHPYYDKSQSEWDLYSMEAITRFDDGPERSLESYVQRALTMSSPEKKHRNSYGRRSGSEVYDSDDRNEERQRWEEANVAYVRDDADSDRSSTVLEYSRKSLNLDEDSSKSIKIIKRPVGKPVKVPVPPPLPKSDSFSC